jgi:hypothetical protein
MGAKHIKHLLENAAVIEIDISQEDELRVREEIGNFRGMKGSRYLEAMLLACFGDSIEVDAT